MAQNISFLPLPLDRDADRVLLADSAPIEVTSERG
jgi:hypothetical protein